jgi:uncharacterized protein (TIGR02265 family)
MRPGASRAPTDAARFAADLRVSAWEKAAIVVTLESMPSKQMCRGMFFQGVLDTMSLESSEAQRILDELSIEPPRTAFGLYPHYGFYKLSFWAARHLYPKLPLDEGLYRLAASFFPIFSQSMVGRTIASLMGTRPISVLSRLVDAYRLSVPMNKHEVQSTDASSARWTCEVELGEFYPHIFRGIIIGTMQELGVPNPAVEVVHRASLTTQSITFAIRWRD